MRVGNYVKSQILLLSRYISAEKSNTYTKKMKGSLKWEFLIITVKVKAAARKITTRASYATFATVHITTEKTIARQKRSP
jgi:hypothetical protein